MTLYLENIKGTLDEVYDLFENSETVSVRHYAPSRFDNNNFDIILRCNEEQKEKIGRKKVLKNIIKALEN